ncbi:MAG: choice-of-anchor B family protein [Bacteroidota bacterium]
MKRIFALFFLLSFAVQAFAQLNATLRDQFEYTDGLNDIWGYVAPDGTEYAVVGLQNGVSFVNLSNPDNVFEAASIPGQFSTWRDLKTFGEYAYVVADQGSSDEGLTIIDLTDLANGNVTFTHNQFDIPGTGRFTRAHNIYIDTDKGRAFIAGANHGNRGILVFDIASMPGEAIYLTTVGTNYSHDTYLNGNLLFNSDINNGVLSIWEVSDIFAPVLLSTTVTPFAFTHNAWSTADNSFVFTTDERGNAPVAAYDITDPTDPILVDEYRPAYSLNTGTIPHNTHVLNEYLITSYYTDGVTVVDASDSDNLIEVANWDTWAGGPGGFNGSWGAYPFLPSGLVLASDITNGLFVVEMVYQRAARLEGTITDAESGQPINGVEVSIQAVQENGAMSDASGQYRTGLANGGNFQITFSHPDYISVVETVDLVNGETTVLDITMESTLIRHSVSANVVEAEVLTGIEDAEVLLVNVTNEISIFSDETGVASFDFVPEGVYDVYVGRWGYRELFQENVAITAPISQTFELEVGYQDGFQLDLGWTTSIDGATTGLWERGVPFGTFTDTIAVAPGVDADGDIGNQAYVTGNSDASESIGFDDIDNGSVILTSPIFDLSIYQDSTVRLSYQYWFANFLGNGPEDDDITVSISNGTDEVILAIHDDGTPGLAWREAEYNLSEFIQLSDQMQLTVITGDNGAGNITEAGFDDFFIEGDFLPTSTENIALAGLEAEVFPNPSFGEFSLRYSLPNQSTELQLEITDALGRNVQTQRLAPFANGVLTFGNELPAGTYFLRMLNAGEMIYSTKLVKN